MKINEEEMLKDAQRTHEELMRWYREVEREHAGVNNVGLPTYIELMERFSRDPVTGGSSFGYNAEYCGRNADFYREMQSRNYRTVKEVLKAFEERVFDTKEVHDWIQNDMVGGFEEPLIRKGYPEFTRLLETHTPGADEEGISPPKKDG